MRIKPPALEVPEDLEGLDRLWFIVQSRRHAKKQRHVKIRERRERSDWYVQVAAERKVRENRELEALMKGEAPAAEEFEQVLPELAPEALEVSGAAT